MIPSGIRIELYEWLFEKEFKMFGREKDIEIIFLAANIIDKYCNRRAKLINLTEYKEIARAALVISAQYNNDEYEFVCDNNRKQNKNRLDVLETINYEILPPENLRILYDLTKSSDQKIFIYAFFFLIVSLLDYDTDCDSSDICVACFNLASKIKANTSIDVISGIIYSRALKINGTELMGSIKRYLPYLKELFKEF